MNLLIIIISLYISITIHELGHYLASKAFNVPVKTFCIGIGPKLIAFNKFNTNFILKPLPISGYITHECEDLDKISLIKEWTIQLAGVTLNLVVAFISLSIFLNKSLIVNSKIIFTKLLLPTFTEQFKISNNIGSEVALSSTLPEALNVFNPNQYILVFIAINITLFCINLLPLPIFDGGKLIMSILRRWGSKSPKRARITKRVNYFIYPLCSLLLIFPILINESLKNPSVIQIFLYVVNGILFYLLFKVIKETDIYKRIIKK